MGSIIGDELVRGAHGAAGEIAYLPLVADPFHPRHPLHGALEDEIGAAGIVAAFNARSTRHGRELTSVHEVFELAGSDDQAARHVVEHVASRLGETIATVCAILDPELVVLGGGSAPARCSRARPGLGGRAGPDHRTDRDQPPRRPGGTARGGRDRAAGRARAATLAGTHALLMPRVA